MNWDAIGFDWNQIRAFLATAEEGSLSAAARALRQTQPTISRQVSALEESLGVTLFERGPRRMMLTDSGRDLLAHVRVMADAATKVSLTASGQSQDVSGKVMVTATSMFASQYLPDILLEVRDKAPGIVVEVITSNDIKDLTRREADISIRHARPEQSDLIAKLVAEAPASLYATEAFLQRVGNPSSIEELEGVPVVGFGAFEEVAGAYAGLGLSIRPADIAVNTRDGHAIVAFARAGLGMSLLTLDMADSLPGFRRVLPDMPDIPVPVWLVTHRELHTSPRIRLVYDAIARRLAHVNRVQFGRGGAG